MIVFPGTKINLGLYVHPRRPDGFHNLETCFYPAPFSDLLELLPAERENLKYTGIPLDGDPESNLCTRALRLLQSHFPGLKPVYLHLHKLVPAGAGLGGGSADATAVLKVMLTLYNLKATKKQLEEWALQLGSDCPFFLHQQPLLATGRGEHFQPAAFSLKGYWLCLILPGIHVSTKAAFATLRYQNVPPGWTDMLSTPVKEWEAGGLRNDFEAGIFSLHPELSALKKLLYGAGALYAAMSGSGSTLFGIFDHPEKPAASFFPDHIKMVWYPLD